MTDVLVAAIFVVSVGLIVAAFATVSPFAGLLSAGLIGLGLTIAYVRGGER